MEQLTKNQAVATSQEAVQNQIVPQLPADTANYTLSLHDALPISSTMSTRSGMGTCATSESRKRTRLAGRKRSEEHTSELQSRGHLVCRLLLEKKNMDLAAKGLGAKEWNNSLKTKLSLLPKKLYRIRLCRNFRLTPLTTLFPYTTLFRSHPR